MSFILRVGLPRSTKSYSMVKSIIDTLHRNKKWYESKKTPTKRQIYTNLLLSEKLMEDFSDYINVYSDSVTFDNIVKNVSDSDVFIDEISIYFDADNYMNIPHDYKRFLNEYARRGNSIEATTQDASQLYKRARRKVTKIYQHYKLIGNPSPSPTRPKIKYIWGVFMMVQSKFALTADGELELKIQGFPSFGMLSRDVIEAYDTRQELKSLKYGVLSHYEYKCLDEHCTFTKTVHK